MSAWQSPRHKCRTPIKQSRKNCSHLTAIARPQWDNPMPVYDRSAWCNPDDARCERYVGQLVGLVSRLMWEHFPVFYFATQPSDKLLITDVLALIGSVLLAVYGDPEKEQAIRSTKSWPCSDQYDTMLEMLGMPVA